MEKEIIQEVIENRRPSIKNQIQSIVNTLRTTQRAI